MQRMMKNLKHHAALPLSLVVALAMAGCIETGTSSLGSAEDEHDPASSEHPGRLVIASRDGAGDPLYVYDLEEGALLPGSLALDNAPSALYTSPGKRFVLALQRTANQVQIIDGGLYYHDDHVDEVAPGFAGTLSAPHPPTIAFMANKRPCSTMEMRAAVSWPKWTFSPTTPLSQPAA